MIKAASHIHSDWSYDGKWSLTKLAAEFHRKGYDMLLMTEHDRGFTPQRFTEYRKACVNASTNQLLVVPGIEYSDTSNTIHVMVWGLGDFLGENLATGDLLRTVREMGGAAVLAHPSRKGAWTQFDPAWIPGLAGIEVWNRKTDGWAPSQDAVALIAQTSLRPFVGMDFHTRRQLFPMATVLEVPLSAAEASVVACIKDGKCGATVFGRPVARFMPRGWRQTGLRFAEFGRRTAARTVKRLVRVR
jgi:hypothetical protein